MSPLSSGDYLSPLNPGSTADSLAFLQGIAPEDRSNRPEMMEINSEEENLCLPLRPTRPPLAGDDVTSLKKHMDTLYGISKVLEHLVYLTHKGDAKAFQIFEQAYKESRFGSQLPFENLLQRSDADGQTLLHMAINSTNLEGVVALIEMGAPLWAFNKNQLTPLTLALLRRICHQLNPTQPEFTDRASAIADRLLEVDGGVSTEFLHRKLLGHIFALKGTSELFRSTFALENLQSAFALQASLVSAVPFYTQLCGGSCVPENELWKAITTKLAPACLVPIGEASHTILKSLAVIPEVLAKSLRYRTDPNILDRLKPGEPLPLVGGWKGHTVGAVVIPYEHRSKFSALPEIRYEILVCNRGVYDSSWGERQPGVQAFRTDRRGAREVVANWHQQLTCLEESLAQEERDIHSYTRHTIRQGTDGTHLAAQFLHTQGLVDAWAAHLMAPPRAYYFEAMPSALLPQPAQVVDNCTWANLQSMEWALVYQILSQFVPPENAKSLAQTIMGLREAEAQAYALMSYLFFHLPRENELPWDCRILEEVMIQLMENSNSWNTPNLAQAYKALQPTLDRLAKLD